MPTCDQISRRKFLKSASGITGLALLGLPASATADCIKGSSDEGKLTLAYYNGHTLTPANKVSSGEESLSYEQVRVTIAHHRGLNPILLSLSPVYHTEHEPIQFHAWARSSTGNMTSTFKILVTRDHGLTLCVRHNANGGAPAEEMCCLTLGSDAGKPKLRTGMYLLGRSADIVRGVSEDDDYLTLDVQRA